MSVHLVLIPGKNKSQSIVQDLLVHVSRKPFGYQLYCAPITED